MKIVHITYSMLNGGKENILIDIAAEQKKRKHEVSIIVVNKYIDPYLHDIIREKQLPYYNLKREYKSYNPIPFLKLYYLLKFVIKPDIIHSHDVTIIKVIKRFFKAKSVLTVHGPRIDTSSIELYDSVCSISGSVQKELASRGNISSVLVYNGINMSSIRKRENKSLSGRLNIVMVSRLDHHVKGQDVLIRACNYLSAHHKELKYTVDFIGKGSSYDYLQQLIAKFDLNDIIKLSGNIDRELVFNKLADYDLFIQPGRLEGFGLTLVEAISAKIPVIAANIQGPAEILNDPELGFLFECENYEELAKQIVKVSELYESGEIYKYIENAYNSCLARFDISRTVSGYMALYEQLIAG